MTPTCYLLLAVVIGALLFIALRLERKVKEARNTRHFISLPIGTRFVFNDADGIWVVLELEGCGRAVEWKGLDYPASKQKMRLVTEEDRLLKEVVVTVVTVVN